MFAILGCGVCRSLWRKLTGKLEIQVVVRSLGGEFCCSCSWDLIEPYKCMNAEEYLIVHSLETKPFSLPPAINTMSFGYLMNQQNAFWLLPNMLACLLFAFTLNFFYTMTVEGQDQKNNSALLWGWQVKGLPESTSPCISDSVPNMAFSSQKQTRILASSQASQAICKYSQRRGSNRTCL